MFLTTNRIKEIDDAFQSRISVALSYTALGFDTRKTVWSQFLKKVALTKRGTVCTPGDLDWLAKREGNGRQVSCLIELVRRYSLISLTRSRTSLRPLMPWLRARDNQCHDRIWKKLLLSTRNSRRTSTAQASSKTAGPIREF